MVRKRLLVIYDIIVVIISIYSHLIKMHTHVSREAGVLTFNVRHLRLPYSARPSSNRTLLKIMFPIFTKHRFY